MKTNNDFIPSDLAFEITGLCSKEDYDLLKAQSFGFWFKKELTDVAEFVGNGVTGAFFGYSFFAPTYEQIFNWFRERHNIDPRFISWTVKRYEDGKLCESIVWHFSAEPVGKPSKYRDTECSEPTRRQAEIKCLEKLIDLINPKKK